MSGKRVDPKIKAANAKARRKRWYDKYHERQHWKRRETLTGFSKGAFSDAVARQESKCALCQNPFKNSYDTCADHDHQLKKPRGVLCRRCNISLGGFEDSPELLQKAIEYLEFWSKQ